MVEPEDAVGILNLSVGLGLRKEMYKKQSIGRSQLQPGAVVPRQDCRDKFPLRVSTVHLALASRGSRRACSTGQGILIN